MLLKILRAWVFHLALFHFTQIRENKIFSPVHKHISKLYLLFKKKSKPEEQNFQVSNPDEHFISDTYRKDS